MMRLNMGNLVLFNRFQLAIINYSYYKKKMIDIII